MTVRETVDAYAALGEDDRYRSELQEGNLVMSPSPAPDHMIVMRQLLIQLDEQLPSCLQVIPDIDVDLELTPRSKPGFVRRPDLIVVHQAAVDRVRRDGGIPRPRSAGRRRDRVTRFTPHRPRDQAR